jgi:hypothetical protein
MMRPVRIGTWNLDGRWGEQHLALMLEADCDVWLLTEIRERTILPGYAVHASAAPMGPRRHWAAIASRLPMASLPDPHPASAAAQVGATTYVSSVLPWRGASRSPWVGAGHADRTTHAVDELLLHLRAATRLVWGGDWNHALSGPEAAGSKGGRLALMNAVAELRLDVPTAEHPHWIDGLLSIDHVAVPRGTHATATRIAAELAGKRLSDHDAYVVDVADPTT